MDLLTRTRGRRSPLPWLAAAGLFVAVGGCDAAADGDAAQSRAYPECGAFELGDYTDAPGPQTTDVAFEDCGETKL